MKILQVCKKFPFPLKDGESIVVTHLARAMHALGCEVTLLTMNTTKHYFPLAELPDDFNHYKAIHAVTVDNRITWWGAIHNLFEGSSYHAVRFQSEAFRQKLIGLLQREQFDVVQLETPFLAPYIAHIRRHSDAIIAMRAHNVEHEIWERYADNQPWPLSSYLRLQATRLRDFELRHLNDYDLLISITARDLAQFRRLGYRGRAVVAPVGLDIRDYHPDICSFRKKPLSVQFIGSLDWLPNREGLDWFLAYVWPLVMQRHPQARFHIAGRNMPRRIRMLHQEGVVVHGEVPSATDFINAHSIMVVPLFSGSGMRVKILEGMALGKAIVTTSLGLEGIDARSGREVRIAETAAEFVEALDQLLLNPRAALALGEAARRVVEQYFDNLHVGGTLLEAFNRCIGHQVQFAQVYAQSHKEES